MIVPVDGDEREAQHVDEQTRQRTPKRVERHAVGRPELEREDRDDHGHHGVAEGLESTRAQVDRCGGPAFLVIHRAGDDMPVRMTSDRIRCPAEASGFLVGPAVFKTVVGARAPRRVRFPSASAKVPTYERRDEYPSHLHRPIVSRGVLWGEPLRMPEAGRTIFRDVLALPCRLGDESVAQRALGSRALGSHRTARIRVQPGAAGHCGDHRLTRVQIRPLDRDLAVGQ